ncbi:MAG: patatin-like phospholipase family protein [Congregibacter sp.]
MSEKPIHLVLGSGGARGLTHIGVVRVLKEHGYRIQSITGCSMGALVGALYVSGHLDEYEEWVSQLTRWDVLRFLDISLLGRAGMVKGDRLVERLSEWLGGVDMESLPIPLTVVAADIIARKEVWISRGDLMNAVRASIAVPGVFSPLVTHGRVLVDGGILNPLPIPPSRMDNSAIIVAVSLSGREVSHPFGDPEGHAAAVAASKAVSVSVEQRSAQELGGGEASDQVNDSDLPSQVDEQHQPIDSFLDSLTRFFGRDRNRLEEADTSRSLDAKSIAKTISADESSRPALTDVMLGMINTMQDTIARHQLASNPPDRLIDIPCNICQSHEFHKAKELIPAGAYWARRALLDQEESP